MKKFYIILALSTAVCTSVAQGNSVLQLKNRYAMHLEDNAAEYLWCPSVQVYSSMKNNEWNKDRRYNTTYNSMGNILTDVNEDLNWTPESTSPRYTSETYTYNEFGKRLTGLIKTGNDLDNLTDSRKFDFTYDEVVPTFITSYSNYYFRDGDWVKDKSSYKVEVSRDSEGRVTQVLRSQWDVMGFYQDYSKSEITYGDDGKPAQIKSSSYQEDWSTGDYSWVEGTTLTEIDWKDCDNQILNGGALYQGANRINSAKLLSGGEENGSLSVVYGPGEKDYTVTSESIDSYWGDRIVALTEWREINPYNSYSILDKTETYSEGYEEPSVSSSFESITRDAYGNLIEGLLTNEYYGMTSVLEHQTGVVEYDETYGYPLVYTESQMDFYDQDKQVPFLLKEFSDYVNVAGVENVVVDNDETKPVEYYNIQGVRVQNPTSGLYIVRRGSKVSKVVIR